jgi:hypothetical protein
MSFALPVALASQHIPEIAQFWDLILHPPPEPSPAIRPEECGPYVHYTASYCARFSLFMIVGLYLGCFFLMLFLGLSLAKEDRKFIKRLAESTLEEREEELSRICKEAGIKIERRQKSRKEKMEVCQLV